MKVFKLKSIVVTVSGCLILLAGCSTAKLSNVQQTRGNYNIALNQSDNEQFLLNIVRMRFDKSPFFVSVDSVTTQTTLNYNTGGEDTKVGNLTAPGTLGAFWNFQPSVEFIHTPTITYSPLQGSSFISGLLLPVSMTQLNYLVQTNISLSSAFKLTVDNIGGLGNIANIWEHSESSVYASGESFNHFVDYVDKSRIDGKLELFMTNYKNESALSLIINDSNTAAEIAKELQLGKAYTKIILTPAISSTKQGNVVQLRTRSFFAVLNFLSYGVDSSAADEKKFGVSSNGTGSQNQLTNGLFALRSSDSSPSNTHTKVLYEGRWYYIPNSDITSKSTLMFLKLIYSLEAGEVETNPWGSINVKETK